MPSPLSASSAATSASAPAGAAPGQPGAILHAGSGPAFRLTQQEPAPKAAPEADFSAILARLSEGQGKTGAAANEAIARAAARFAATESETPDSDADDTTIAHKPDPEAEVTDGATAPALPLAPAAASPGLLPDSAKKPLTSAASPHRQAGPGQAVSRTLPLASDAAPHAAALPQQAAIATPSETAEAQAIRPAPAPGMPAPPAEAMPKASPVTVTSAAGSATDTLAPGKARGPAPEPSGTPQASSPRPEQVQAVTISSAERGMATGPASTTVMQSSAHPTMPTAQPAHRSTAAPATPSPPFTTAAAVETGPGLTAEIAAGPATLQSESPPARISPPAAPSPQLAYHVARQIAEAAARPSRQSVELRLDPEELGPVRLTLSGNDHSLAMTITAERGETLDLMRRHIAALEQEYRALGYTDIRFSFGTSDNAPHSGGSSDAPPDGRNRHAGAPDEAAPPVPGRSHRSASPDGGLDLRL